MSRLLSYLNPIERLGYKRYSFALPFLITLFIYILSEIFAYWLVHDPMVVGTYIIFVSVFLIIYFAFRDGIRGGVITTFLTVFYYLEIIYTRRYHDQQLFSGLETTAILFGLYLILGGVVGWLKQRIDDLIEREANEKSRLQTIVQQLPVGVIVTDKNGKVELSNKRAETILGAKVPLGFKVGQESLIAASENGKRINGSESLLYQALTSKKDNLEKEYVISRPDGKQIAVQVSASAIKNREGKIVAAAEILNDITLQKDLERRKDDFVNMASHELKTPITSMNLYVDSLAMRIKSYKDARASKTLTSIKYQTLRLQKLVSDLLDVSRLQTGKLSFSKENFRLDKLVEETVDELQATAAQNIVFSPKLAVEVKADKFRIYQVLTNLITNAIKYSPDTPSIKVAIRKVGQKAIVSVQDFGIGIDKSEQKRIFERLYQVSDDKEKTFPGFGMGLYISKEIIKRHRGQIWVESQKGQGSIFLFSLSILRK